MREVLVVRPDDEFSRTLRSNGYSVINCPVIRTEPLDDLSELEDVASRLAMFDGVFITSSAAAEILVDRASRQFGTYPGRIFVLGRRSFDVLKHATGNVAFDESANTAGEMLDTIGKEELRGKRFLFVRGERSMRTIPERLNGIADVEEVIVYRTMNVVVEGEKKREIRDKALRGAIVMTCFFSPSAVGSFVDQFGIDLLRHTGLASIGEITAAALDALDLDVDVVAGTTGGAHFAADVLTYLKPAAKGV